MNEGESIVASNENGSAPNFTGIARFMLVAAAVVALAAIVIAMGAKADTTFASESYVSDTATSVSAIDACDIDGDGDIDTISVSEDADVLRWYENDGSGTSWTPHMIDVADAMALTHADLDGDGDNDIAVLSYNDFTLNWYENTAGDGTSWTLRGISSAVWGPSDVAAADMDSDGDVDLVVSHYTTSQVLFFENDNGDGLAWTSHEVATFTALMAVFPGDVDGDGDLDIISASGWDASGRVDWNENVLGDGSVWTAHSIGTAVNFPWDVSAADMDGDGDLDAVSASEGDSTVAWYENDVGDGTSWTEHIITSSAWSARAVCISDLDLDGDLDVVSVPGGLTLVGWYENTDGDASAWTSVAITTSASDTVGILAVDVDMDGDQDILTASYTDGDIILFENLLPATYPEFTSSIPISFIPGAGCAIGIDIDGDGWLDVASASEGDSTVGWFRSTDGAGSFAARSTISNIVSGANSLAGGDFDGDGDTDLAAVAYFGDRVYWFENVDGAGTSWTSYEIVNMLWGAPKCVAAGDIDGDGDLDIAVAFEGDSSIRWLENTDGAGTFTLHAIGTENWAYHVDCADIDGDGDIDLVSVGDATSWWENVNGDGTFWVEHDIGFYGNFGVCTGDIDGDGDLDVISATTYEIVVWYENSAASGDGSLWTLHPIGTSVNDARDVCAADLDNDGDLDIACASQNDNSFSWLENLDGEGKFSTRKYLDTGMDTASSVDACDLDGDGDLDIVTATINSNVVAWHRNDRFLAPVYNMDKDVWYKSLALAIDEADSGNSLTIDDAYVFAEGVTIDGKTINIVDSDFRLDGNIVLKNNAVLNVDPSNITQTGNIYVNSGSTLPIDASTILMNCTFDGQYGIQVNATGTLLMTNGAMLCSFTGFSTWLNALAGSFVTIENSTVSDCGFDLANPGVTVSSAGAFFYQSTFTNSFVGLALDGAPSSVVRECTFTGNGERSLMITGSDGVLVQENSFESYNDIQLYSESSDNLMVRGNGFTSSWNAIYASSQSGTSIIGNTFNESANGIFLFLTTTAFVYGNDFTGILSFDEGIGINGGTGCIIQHNDITRFQRGIVVTSGSGNQILENNITDNELYGIRLFSAATGNLVRGNSIQNVSNASGFGIILTDGCDGNSVDWNNVTLCPNAGIWVDVSSDGNTISHNRVDNVTLAISVNNDSDDCVMADNFVESANYGVLSQSNSDRTQILRNTVTGVSFAGVYVYDGEDLVVNDNLLESNNYGIQVDNARTAELARNLMWNSSAYGLYANSGSIVRMTDGYFAGNGVRDIFCQGTGSILWNISGFVVLSDGISEINGLIRVSPGGDLDIVRYTLDGGSYAIDGMASLADSMTTVISENVWVNGTLFVNASHWQMDCAFNGEHGIQVNATGALTIQNASVIDSPAARFFFRALEGSFLSIGNSTVSGCGWTSPLDPEIGVYVEADGAKFWNSTFTGGYCGLALVDSIGSQIWYCDFNGNDICGLYLNRSHSTLVAANIFMGEVFGAYLADSNNNLFYANLVLNCAITGFNLSSGCVDNDFVLNHFIGNAVAANDESFNDWNWSYGMNGNYWDDWTGPDQFWGPNQDRPGSDGIVDIPRAIPGSNFSFDMYPLSQYAGNASAPLVTINAPTDGGWAYGIYELNVTIIDPNGDGDDSTYMYSMNGGAWQPLVNAGGPYWTVVFDAAAMGYGPHAVRVTANDTLNNTGYDNATFLVDVFDPYSFMATAGTVWYDGPLLVMADGRSSILLSAFDNETGVDYIEYSIDGGAWTAYAGPLTSLGLGPHNVSYRAVDLANNTEDETTVDFYVAPYITGTVGGSTWYVDGYVFACNVTLVGDLFLQGSTLIMNSTAGNTQYFIVADTGQLQIIDDDMDASTIAGESTFTNIDPSHYYTMAVYGYIGVRYSSIEHCGFIDFNATIDPTTIGVCVDDGIGEFFGARLYSPLGVGVYFRGANGSLTLVGSEENAAYFRIHECVIGFGFEGVDGNVFAEDYIIEDCSMMGGWISNTTDLYIEDFVFTGNGWGSPMEFGVGLYVQNASPVLFSCDFYMNPMIGMFVQNAAPVVDRCRFWNNSGPAFFADSSDATITRSQFADNDGFIHGMPVEVICRSDDYNDSWTFVFENNTLINTLGANGILVDGNYAVKIRNNELHTDNMTVGVGTHGDIAPTIAFVDISGNNVTGTNCIWVSIMKQNETVPGDAFVGDLVIRDNTIATGYSGIMVNVEMRGATSASIGDIDVSGNRIDGGVQSVVVLGPSFFLPQAGAVVSAGRVSVTGNVISNQSSYTVSFRLWLEDVVSGSFDYGSWEVSGNVISDCWGGILIDQMFTNLVDTDVSMAGYSFTGNDVNVTGGGTAALGINYLPHVLNAVGGSFAIGDTTISGNTMVSQGTTIYYWGCFEIVTDMATTLGDYHIEGNDVHSMFDAGIAFDYYDFDGIYGTSEVTVGQTWIRNNTVTGAFGISIVYDCLGCYDDATLGMSGTSSIHTGRMYVDYNQVSTHVGFALSFNIDWILRNTDGGTVTMDMIVVRENHLVANDVGLCVYFYDIGRTVYGSSTLYFNTMFINHNTIVSGGDGMYFNIYDVGRDMHGETGLFFDEFFQVWWNDILAGGDGINVMMNQVGYDMHDFGYLAAGQFKICQNNITADGNGVSLTPITRIAYEMYDQTQVWMGLWGVWHNNISAGSSGIFMDANNIACSLDGDVHVEFEFIEFIENTIEASANGIEIPAFDSFGRDVAGSTKVFSGGMHVDGNTVNATMYGIYAGNLQNWGVNMWGTSLFRSEMTSFSGNAILSGWTGIYLGSFSYHGYWMYENSKYETYGLAISENTIESDDVGIYLGYISYLAYYMYGPSLCEFGEFVFNHNDINSRNDGISVDEIRWLGVEMDDTSTATFGRFMFDWNTINSTDSYGMYFWFALRDCAKFMDGNSHVTLAGYSVSNNTIISYGEGIDIDHYDRVGMEMYGYATMSMGDFVVDGNDIISTNGYGIYLMNFHNNNGIWNYDSTVATFGAVTVSQNRINASYDGIYLEMMDYHGYELSNYASATFGDIEFNGNDITAGWSGIDIYEIRWHGTYLYDHAKVIHGMFEFNGNVIDAVDYGMYFDFAFRDCAKFLEEYNLVTLAGYQINGNVISSVGTGIDVEHYDRIGMEMYGFASMTMGDFEIVNNIVNSTDGYGIYLYRFHNNNGIQNDDSTVAAFGLVTVSRNRIDSYDAGIYIDMMSYHAYDLDDFAIATFGSILVNENEIVSDGNGIYVFDISGYAEYMYWQTYAEFGDIEFCGNVIRSNGTGMYWENGFCDMGYWMEDAASAVMGSYRINDNDIVAADDGIYFDYFCRIGTSLFANARFEMGNLEVLRNIVDAGWSGLYFNNIYRMGFKMGYDYDVDYEYLGRTTFVMGDILFNDNRIVAASSEGIYVGNLYSRGTSMFGMSSATLGDVQVCNNTVMAWYDAISFGEWHHWGTWLFDFSSVTLGKVLVNGNDLTANYSGGGHIGIYWYELYEVGFIMGGETTVTFGGIEMCGNAINASGDGIWVEGFYDFGEYMYSDSSVSVGDVLFNDNRIDAGVGPSGWGSGIWISQMYYFGYETNGMSLAVFGDFEFNRNTISSVSEGIFVAVEDWAGEMDDSSTVAFGHFQVNWNYITTTSSVGIDLNEFWYVGYDMYGTTSMSMGNLEISWNEIRAYDDGIQYDLYEIGYYLQESASCVFGSFRVNGNDIVSEDGEGIYVGQMVELGAYLDDSSAVYGLAAVSFGDFKFNGNSIVSQREGIYVENLYDWGYELYDGASATFGHVQFNGNDINSNGSRGMYLYGFDDMGAFVYDDATVWFDQISVNGNTIESFGTGIYIEYIEYLGWSMDGSASVDFAGLSVSGNGISSEDGDGIYVSYYAYNGAYLYEQSGVDLGEHAFDGNTIEAQYSGIYFDTMEYCVYDLNGASYAYFPGLSASGNEIAANNSYGIYLYPQDFAFSLYDESTAVLGDWHFDGNSIVSDEEGIVVYTDYFGTEAYGQSSATIGSCSIDLNDITTSSNGIDAWWMWEFGCDLYEDASVTVGDAYIRNNTLIAGLYGITTGPWDTGQRINDNAMATYGDYIVTGNSITSDNVGIDYYLYYMARDLDSWAYPSANARFAMGDTIIADNAIVSPYTNGIMVEADNNFGEIHGTSMAMMGDLLVLDNTVTSGADGITFNMNAFATGIYDSATVEIGAWVVEGNTVVSDYSIGVNIWMGWSARFVMGSSSVEFAGVEVTDNVITALRNGIVFEQGLNGNVLDTASVAMPGFAAIGNTVDPYYAGLILNLTEPEHLDAGASVVYGDITVADSMFEGGWYGVLFQWRNALGLNLTYDLDPSVLVQNVGIAGIDATATGISLLNFGDVVLDRVSVSECSVGISMVASNVYAENMTMVNITVPAAFYDGSYAYTLNITSVNTGVPYFDDFASLLDMAWHMEVHVVYYSLNPAPGATVTIEGPLTPAQAYTADSIGMVRLYDLMSFSGNATGIITDFNSYNVSATAGLLSGYTVVPWVNEYLKVYVYLVDAVDPWFVADHSDPAGTTGEVYRFACEADDLIGVAWVNVTYQLGGPFLYASLDFNATSGYWETDVTMPNDYVGPMDYVFTVTDFGLNQVVSGLGTAAISDNDAPAITADDSDTAGTTGELVGFALDATDNIAVTGAYVVYWFGVAAPGNATMVFGTQWTASIAVPSDMTEDLHYRLAVRDAAGNWAVSGDSTISITDNDLPWLLSDASQASATTNDTYDFNFTLADNVGVVNATLEYWFGLGNHTVVSFLGPGPHSLTIIAPKNSTETLHYLLSGYDATGNHYTGMQVDISVLDNDAPIIGVVSPFPVPPTTGEMYEWLIKAYDNIAIWDVYVEYWADAGPHYNLTAGLAGAWYQAFNSSLPDDATMLHYIISAVDASGNWCVLAQVDVAVVDNDAPIEVGTFISSGPPTTGDPATFRILLSDNIGVTEAYVLYWYDDEPMYNATLSWNGTCWTTTITIRFNYTRLFNFTAAARDAAGNWLLNPMASWISVPVADNDPPLFIWDYSDPQGMTGNDFKFIADIMDYNGIANAYVVYWQGNGTETNLTMVNGALFYTEATLPLDSVDMLYYYFAAVDNSGNWVVTVVLNVTVYDDEKPEWIGHGWGPDTTGEVCTLLANLTDNIGVTYVEVDYWYGFIGPITTLPMTANGSMWSVNVTLPGDSLAPFYFTIHAYDAAGNHLWFSDNFIIYDNDAPTIVNDTSVADAYLNEAYAFEADIVDNIGVEMVTVFYSFDNVTFYQMVMDGSGPYGVTALMPYGGATEVYYRFEAADAAGNLAVSPTYTKPLIDAIAPFNLIDNSIPFAYTGNTFWFRTLCDDNVAVQSVHVVYDLSDGSGIHNETLAIGTDGYELDLLIPANSTATIAYHFEAVDTSGNWLIGPLHLLGVYDDDHPAMTEDLSDALATTGDEFTFGVRAIDNIGVTLATVTYWVDGGAATTETMAIGTSFVAHATMPSDSLGELYYYFVVQDAAGNWLVGTTQSVTIADNDAPELAIDFSPASATTGDALTFWAAFEDNIGVSSASLTYSFGASNTTIAMGHIGGGFGATINVPAGQVADIEYSFIVLDYEGNTLVTPTQALAVDDNDAPIIAPTAIPSTGVTGGTLTVTADVTDNIALSSVTLHYWFGYGLEQTLSMSGTGSRTASIPVPSDSLDTAWYYIDAVDTSGNAYQVGTYRATIADSIAPTNLLDSSQIFATTGDAFHFAGEADDNIAVATSHLVYWLGSGAQTNVTISGGAFDYYAVMPLDSTEMLHYYVAFVDAAGNWLVGQANGVMVQDNDSPTVTADYSDPYGKKGEEYAFEVRVADNVGVTEVTVRYWFGINEAGAQTVTLTQSGISWTGAITPDEVGDLNYRITVGDADGNSLETAVETVGISSASVAGDDDDGAMEWCPWVIIVLLVVALTLLGVMYAMKSTGGKAEEEPEAAALEAPVASAGSSGDSPKDEPAATEPAKGDAPDEAKKE